MQNRVTILPVSIPSYAGNDYSERRWSHLIITQFLYNFFDLDYFSASIVGLPWPRPATIMDPATHTTSARRRWDHRSHGPISIKFVMLLCFPGWTVQRGQAGDGGGLAQPGAGRDHCSGWRGDKGDDGTTSTTQAGASGNRTQLSQARHLSTTKNFKGQFLNVFQPVSSKWQMFCWSDCRRDVPAYRTRVSRLHPRQPQVPGARHSLSLSRDLRNRFWGRELFRKSRG